MGNADEASIFEVRDITKLHRFIAERISDMDAKEAELSSVKAELRVLKEMLGVYDPLPFLGINPNLQVDEYMGVFA